MNGIIKDRSAYIHSDFTRTIWYLPFLCLVSFSVANTTAKAQEIDFGDFSSLYSASLTELNPTEDLDFGIIIIGEGVKTIPLVESKVMVLEAVKYLDVILDIQADNEMLLNGDMNCVDDPTCSIPFTLQAAYANRGENNFSHAVLMNASGNMATVQIPVLQRGLGPPGPPPTPVHDDYNPALFMETAYIYLYGSLNVGNVDAGSYTANITITISYD